MKVEIRFIDDKETVYIVEGDATNTLSYEFNQSGIFVMGRKVITGFLFKPTIIELPGNDSKGGTG